MKVGRYSQFYNDVYLKDASVVVGPLEYSGPLRDFFDYHFEDNRCGEKSWEKAEIKMYKTALDLVLDKTKLNLEDIDAVVSGDLNNQIVIGNYSLRNTGVPYLGVFNACASSCEGLIIASNLISAKNANNVLVNISSHNATAEKQYRYPVEYGGQKPDSITTTVTASASVIVTSEKSDIRITKSTMGEVVDYDLKDAQDMGRAMAPSAYHTLMNHLNDFHLTVNDYDLILTGDLSYMGKELFVNICSTNGITFSNNYEDCGLLIYDRENQQVFSGGSGCGCIASVAFSFILQKMKERVYKKVLLIATGALHNPLVIAQKETIPCIAHAIVLEVE